MVGELYPRRVTARVHAGLLQLRPQLVGVPRPHALLLERLDERDATPRRREVDVVTTESHLRRLDRPERGALDESFRALHRVAIVRVRLVPLDLRELRRVLV